MMLNSKLCYKKKEKYCGEKAYVAEITGYDKVYRFKRDFIRKEVTSINKSPLQPTFYEYSWNPYESGIYEYYEYNGIEKICKYIKYDRKKGEQKEISREEVEKMFPPEN